MGTNKEYLGDGVYASTDGYMIELTAGNGVSADNTIFLEPTVLSALIGYAKTTVDNVLGDIRDRPETQQKVTGATIMIEALKADGLMSEDIDKAKAASEAIRRHIDPMSSPMPIEDMRED